MTYAVAADGSRRGGDDGSRLPTGEVHAWRPGANQTVCGLALSRSRLQRFPHIDWSDTRPESGGAADFVQRVCPRCAAATGNRRRSGRPWTRRNPRP